MKISRNLLTSCVLAILLATLIQESGAQSISIENVAIFDVTSGATLAAQNIVIEDGLIARIGPTLTMPLPDNLTVVPGEGLTVLPGLTDSHVHMTAIDVGTFLANGVTSVRELNGSPEHLKLRKQIAGQEILGPRMLVSSPLISGKEIDFRHVLAETSDQAAKLVEDFHAAGYDYLKIYDDLPVDVYRGIVATAKGLGMNYVGHIPKSVGLGGVLAAEQSIEHNEKIINEVLHQDDVVADKLHSVAQAIARSGVAVTPTLAVHEFLSDRQNEDLQDRLLSDEMAYVDDEIVAWWKSVFPNREGNRIQNEGTGAADFLRAQRILLENMKDLGVPILAGTDTPNPLMIAGFSLHDELDALVRAGLSNTAAIRSATLTPGAQMPWSVPLGKVEVGYAADLVLVVGDPARDLSTLRNPFGVIVGGVWLDKGHLQKILATARRN